MILSLKIFPFIVKSLILEKVQAGYGFSYVDWIIKSDLLPWISKHFKMRAAFVLILFCLHHQIKGLQRDRRSPSHPKKKKSTIDVNKSNGELLCLIILFSVVYFKFRTQRFNKIDWSNPRRWCSRRLQWWPVCLILWRCKNIWQWWPFSWQITKSCHNF